MNPLIPSVIMAAPASSGLGAYLAWIGGLTAMVIAGGVVLLLLRRRLLMPRHGTDATRSLLDHLRRLHERGEMTREEFEATRRAIAGRHAGPVEPPRDHRRRPDPPPVTSPDG